METGYVDFYGHHAAAGGWMICAWVSNAVAFNPRTAQDDVTLRLRFEDGEISGPGLAAYFHRDDLAGRGVGVIFFAPSAERVQGRLVSLELNHPAGPQQIQVTLDTAQLREVDIVGRLRPICTAAFAGGGRTELLGLLSRRGYMGANTLDTLSDFVRIDVDEAIICPPGGVLLIGWYVAMPGVVEAIKLRCGPHMAMLKPEDFLLIERADVMEAVGRPQGLTDVRCGFLAYVPDIMANDEPLHIQVETRRREIGFKNVVAPRLSGTAAIRRILDSFDLQYEDIRPGFAKVVGPAVAALTRARLQNRPKVMDICFGEQPKAPRNSLIVPVYGRIDFIEYQIGLMAAHGRLPSTELIYVLDDPPKQHEVRRLAESLYARFAIPFRLLALSENMGFAPANNIGLRHATGEFICFLNSDVFAQNATWIDSLTHRLTADPSLGAVGPLLLFEDGSVQHEGMEFIEIPVMGDLEFPIHTRKGWRPSGQSGLVAETLITGACMVMRRTLAVELGGFDEAYAIGDFEDTDLCLKIKSRGLTCGVDHDVSLYHLERKSQQGPGERWRMNLTLCNAWTHHERWFADRPETEPGRLDG